MPNQPPDAVEPTREELDQMSGPVLVEIGATWCGFCQATKPHLQNALRDFPGVRRIWIEDGKGRPLGRSFGVKLWPTLVFMRDGKVVSQTSRPDPAQIRAGLESIAGAAGESNS